MARSRIVALATILAVAWTALWPLVSSSWMVANADEMPLCHQAGMQVSPDMAPPETPATPGHPASTKQHCPLCVFAFLAAFEPPVVAAIPTHLDSDLASPAHCAPAAVLITVQLPQPRAPPSVSIS